MNKYTSIFVALSIAILLAACGGTSTDNDTPSAPAAAAGTASTASTERTVVTTTPQALVQTYTTSKSTGDAKFKGHDIELTAPLEKVNTDSGEPVLNFSNGNTGAMNEMNASLSEGQDAILSKLQPGDTVTLLCQEVDGTDGTSLKGCTITSDVHN